MNKIVALLSKDMFDFEVCGCCLLGPSRDHPINNLTYVEMRAVYLDVRLRGKGEFQKLLVAVQEKCMRQSVNIILA